MMYLLTLSYVERMKWVIPPFRLQRYDNPCMRTSFLLRKNLTFGSKWQKNRGLCGKIKGHADLADLADFIFFLIAIYQLKYSLIPLKAGASAESAKSAGQKSIVMTISLFYPSHRLHRFTQILAVLMRK